MNAGNASRSARPCATVVRGLVVLVPVMAAIALVGCGDGSEEATSAGTDNSQPSGANKDLGTINVVMSNQHDLALPGVDAGLEYDSWSDSGLKVKQAISTKGIDALASGDADVTLTSPGSIIGPILQGLPVKMVGATINEWDQYLIVGKNGKYADAQSASDLKGAKFGITNFGFAGDYSTRKLAEKEGWSKSDYTQVTLGTLDGLIAGLKKGAIDAFPWSAVPAYKIQEEGFGRVIGSVADIVQPPTPLDVVVVTDKAIKERPDAVKAFCDGYYAAQKRLQDNPEETIDLFTDTWKVGPRHVVEAAIETELPLIATQSGFSAEQLQGMANAAMVTTPDAGTITADQVKQMTVDCSSL